MQALQADSSSDQGLAVPATLASHCASSSRSASSSERVSADRPPCLSALRATSALPATDRGPVDCFHGCHDWIASDCRARCSAVLK